MSIRFLLSPLIGDIIISHRRLIIRSQRRSLFRIKSDYDLGEVIPLGIELETTDMFDFRRSDV